MVSESLHSQDLILMLVHFSLQTIMNMEYTNRRMPYYSNSIQKQSPFLIVMITNSTRYTTIVFRRLMIYQLTKYSHDGCVS